MEPGGQNSAVLAAAVAAAAAAAAGEGREQRQQKRVRDCGDVSGGPAHSHSGAARTWAAQRAERLAQLVPKLPAAPRHCLSRQRCSGAASGRLRSAPLKPGFQHLQRGLEALQLPATCVSQHGETRRATRRTRQCAPWCAQLVRRNGSASALYRSQSCLPAQGAHTQGKRELACAHDTSVEHRRTRTTRCCMVALFRPSASTAPCLRSSASQLTSG